MPAKPAKVSWDVTDGLTGGPTAIGSPREPAGMVLAGNEGNSSTRITCLQKKIFSFPKISSIPSVTGSSHPLTGAGGSPPTENIHVITYSKNN